MMITGRAPSSSIAVPSEFNSLYLGHLFPRNHRGRIVYSWSSIFPSFYISFYLSVNTTEDKIEIE